MLTFVPRSITVKPLTWSISATMFLPMSWMSPCAVPMTTRPSDELSPPDARIAGSSTLPCMALTTTPARIRSGRNTSSRLKASPIDDEDGLDDAPEEFERRNTLAERVLRQGDRGVLVQPVDCGAQLRLHFAPLGLRLIHIWSPAEVLGRTLSGPQQGRGLPAEEAFLHPQPL